jgi:hypothetical protein
MVRSKNKKIYTAKKQVDAPGDDKHEDHSMVSMDERSEEKESTCSRQSFSDEDDFFIDESLVRLLNILIPRIKYIVAISLLLAFLVGSKIFLFNTRLYSCSAIVAPDVMPDFTSVDIVSMSTDSGASAVPIANQLSQLNALVKSSQVQKGIIQKVGLMELWKCEDEFECRSRLNGAFNSKEVRQVGIEISAKSPDPDLCLQIVNVGIYEANSYFKNLMQSRAKESIALIQSWINDVTEQIELISSEYIDFASNKNITDIESQFAAGNALLGSIKQNIVLKETELTQLKQTFGQGTHEIVPLEEALVELRDALKALVEGRDKDAIYPALSKYEYLRMKVQEYQRRLLLLQNQLELFNKQLATAKIESQKLARSIMILDEPLIEAVGRGTVKFTMLTFIGVFFLGCIFVVLREYWYTIREAMSEKS